jgi:hypothetical protein
MAELLPETGTHHLSDRLRAARRRRFVGRQPEFELFRLTLLDPDLGCGDSPIDALAMAPAAVLLFDTHELLAPPDGWLRESLLPQLSATKRR